MAEMTVDLIRSLKIARDEARSYSELLNLTLERAGNLERLTKVQARSIGQHGESAKALRSENAALRIEIDRLRALAPTLKAAA